MKRIWIPQVIVSVMLLWALNPSNPYRYYMLLRWVCCVVFAFLTFQAFTQKMHQWTWVLGTIALVYNSFLRVHLTREIGSVVDAPL